MTAAVTAVLAVGPWGTLESPALDGPSHAVTALRAAFGDPGLACLQESGEEKEREEGLSSKETVSLLQGT